MKSRNTLRRERRPCTLGLQSACTIGTGTDSGIYAVAVDGAVTLTSAGGRVLQGWLLDGGEVGAVTTVAAGTDPMWSVIVKQ